MRNNIETKRAALEWLKTGGTLLIYPSGGVSTASRYGFGRLEDLPWTTFMAKLVQQSRATVAPVFLHGRNSRLFHVLSHLHSSLRTGLLLRETRRRFGTTVRMEIGEPIAYQSLARLKSRRTLTEYLNRATWNLAHTGTARAAWPADGRRATVIESGAAEREATRVPTRSS